MSLSPPFFFHRAQIDDDLAMALQLHLEEMSLEEARNPIQTTSSNNAQRQEINARGPRNANADRQNVDATHDKKSCVIS